MSWSEFGGEPSRLSD